MLAFRYFNTKGFALDLQEFIVREVSQRSRNVENHVYRNNCKKINMSEEKLIVKETYRTLNIMRTKCKC